MRPFRLLPAIALACVLVTTACGAEIQEAPKNASGESVTVTNCGTPLTIDRVPERVVTNDTWITEIMLALGLADRLVGYTSYPGKERDIATSPWKADFERVPALGDAFTREVVQAAAPDFVFAGWNYGFKESIGLTPDWVRSIGAVPYQLTEACRQPGTTRRGVMEPLDALYTDLTALGDIFGVREKADQLVSQYREQVAGARDSAPEGQEPARVFLFDSATPEPFTSGRTAAPSQIIREAGGTNIFDDLNDSWTTTSWEAVAQRDPQAIVIVDYGAGPENSVPAKIEQLRRHPLMAGTTAVRENNLIALPYAALVEGPRNPQAVVTVADFLRAKGY
ncbi:ABC transporter substrate-binding protein [Nocardia zapadnayensis]|uniref:ABC transporter substrate-binding protein n=1 Tax=Nocardia rhamnosiphila TaxID=426716 RepID=UPI002245EA09|nr:ABC transporter substrate-binding protein [Nocardia zapadnayensis]MCX0272959.1 ABC transporter substrate-binding protein [Nocardia zapadnayensis]